MSYITEANYAAQAILLMKSVPPNEDGTIGVTIKPDMPEWAAWQAYFLGKRMDRRASFMRTRRMNGYMVPCRDPGDFDPDIAEVRKEYSFRVHRGEIARVDTSRGVEEIPKHERLEMAERLKAAFAHLGQERGRSVDRRDAPPPPAPIEPRPLTKAEAASLRRLSGLPEIDERHEDAA